MWATRARSERHAGIGRGEVPFVPGTRAKRPSLPSGRKQTTAGDPVGACRATAQIGTMLPGRQVQTALARMPTHGRRFEEAVSLFAARNRGPGPVVPSTHPGLGGAVPVHHPVRHAGDRQGALPISCEPMIARNPAGRRGRETGTGVEAQRRRCPSVHRPEVIWRRCPAATCAPGDGSVRCGLPHGVGRGGRTCRSRAAGMNRSRMP